MKEDIKINNLEAIKVIDNAIAVQIGNYMFVVQGKRLTASKKKELYLVVSQSLKRLGLISCLQSLDPRPYIDMISNWSIKGDLELNSNKTAKINDIEIADTDNIYYSSRIRVRNTIKTKE